MDNEFKGEMCTLFLIALPSLFLYFCEISDKMAISFKISCFSLSHCFIFSWTPYFIISTYDIISVYHRIKSRGVIWRWESFSLGKYW